MTSHYYYSRLPNIEPGQKVLIKADISERTPNTHINMTLFAGKVMTVKNKSSDYIYLNEDIGHWSWDYRQIQSFGQPVLLKRKTL